LRKIPGVVKDATSTIKSDLQDIKDALAELKKDYDSLGANGKKCADAGQFTPKGCWICVYGPIKYTKDQRKDWEAKCINRWWNFRP
jgi:hypothetical protein